jgi:pyruvate kinase
MTTPPSNPAGPRAKIVCTLGPATSSPEVLRALIDAGMDVGRLNFSHGEHADHRARIEAVRAAATAAGRVVAVLADLQGPKIRLGTFRAGPVRLETGAEFTITTEAVTGDARGASTTYADLARDVKRGDALLVDDGLVRLEAIDSDGVRVRCRVVEGGEVSDHKGINLPGVRVSAPALTPKDRDDLAFALGAGVDAVALSFVRSPGDAVVARAAMAKAGRSVPLFAKLEKPEAVAQLVEIIDGFDGLMVARGDLGVEMPLERVPLVQKRAVRLARAHAKPVIVATQMLESMITHSRPTRAEASDVANAVLDGADALMLSGETSVGKWPVAAVETMRRIIVVTEADSPAPALPPAMAAPNVSSSVAAAAVGVAREVGARAVAAFTRTGATARQVATHRAPVPTLAFTMDAGVLRGLAVVWGVRPVLIPDARTTDEMVAMVDRVALAAGLAERGDLVVLVAGAPGGEAGATNLLRVHRVGAA